MTRSSGWLLGASVLLLLVACAGDDAASNAGSGGVGGSGGVVAGGGGAGVGGSAGVGGGGSGGTGGAGGGGVVGDCGNALHQIFPPGADWNTPIADAPLAGDSQAIIDHLQDAHTADSRFQIDFSIRVLETDASAPHRAFTPTDDFYEIECDSAPPPVPVDGSLEGETGYACESDGDCHLIVVDRDACRLYEMWRANIDSSDTFYGGCLAIWEVDRVYDDNGRGLYCSSADAAGLPIAPLLFSADEIAAGSIPHALRFALPNDLIRNATFVAPGTHATRSASGEADAPAYAARLRLKASADVSGLNAAAQVVAQALKTYGMYLADGGNITFMGRDERDTQSSWEDVGLGPHDLKDLSWSDFEVVDSGPPILWDGDCDRTVITQ